VTIFWDPKKALAELADGRIPDTCQVYASLLEKGPIARFENDDGSRMWGIFSHAEIEKAALDTTTFSNVTVPEGKQRIVPLMVDPPDHAGYRRLINKYFFPASIKATESVVSPIATRLLDTMIGRGSGDFAQEYAYPLATQTLCRHLHVKEDWTIYNDWSSEMERATGSGTRRSGGELPPELIGRIVPYIQSLVSDRRQNPGDDLISGFIKEEVNGQLLDDHAVIGLVMAVILAGRSTTASGIGNLIHRLAEDKALQQYLREHPDRITDAIEELLRIESPQQQMPRRATRDVEVGGELIKAGDSVFLNYGSANVDPARWESPCKFDLDRKKKTQHFAFGRGIHQCFGAPLGRMQMRLTTEELLSRTRSFSVAGPVRRHTWPRLSFEQLPLVFET
jgi:cytochrome P450